ncbi:hypothetical protein B0H10DRAFT_2300306 [Mycena sp. CBHHK59/15]|nr:hypothetical protein B0H10DRAFT_2300306 [Mycena sp. CBHHK59/15]
MAMTDRPNFTPAHITSFRTYAAWLIDSSKDKAPMTEPEMYNTYVYWEMTDGVEDGPQFSPTYDGPIPGVQHGGKLGIPAQKDTDNVDFIKQSAMKYMDVADNAITACLGCGSGVRYRCTAWKGSTWHADWHHSRGGRYRARGSRDGKFTTNAEDFDLRNMNNKREHDEHLREDDDEPVRHHQRRSDYDAITAYLEEHPEEARKILERATAPDDLGLKDLDLGSGSKGKGHRDSVGRSNNAVASSSKTEWRERKGDGDTDDDAEGELEEDFGPEKRA